jgi:hypothetical protein
VRRSIRGGRGVLENKGGGKEDEGGMIEKRWYRGRERGEKGRMRLKDMRIRGEGNVRGEGEIIIVGRVKKFGGEMWGM